MAFSGKVQDVFLITGEGTVLWLTGVVGEPIEGERIETELGEALILALSEPAIRDRSCLMGKKVSPNGAILTDLPMPDAQALHETTVRTLRGLS
ncbi:hypothetical protein RA28_05045 [Ruegeria sp. ANG-S4]|uniref:hypothetical protein n=1 Tax=Ruegeria sp. ANG-S4 TaxID=1577904 RepID=UPI00057D4C11|nr:hypothetical protein [Ruegeria sp. ANG-S4]KIC47069.1 hypothetical protein RA28_05045 [Ruegeria sp. ANG-S4]